MGVIIKVGISSSYYFKKTPNVGMFKCHYAIISHLVILREFVPPQYVQSV